MDGGWVERRLLQIAVVVAVVAVVVAARALVGGVATNNVVKLLHSAKACSQ